MFGIHGDISRGGVVARKISWAYQQTEKYDGIHLGH